MSRHRWVLFDVFTISATGGTVSRYRTNGPPDVIPIAETWDIIAYFKLERDGVRPAIAVARRYRIRFNTGSTPEIEWVVREAPDREVRKAVWGWCDWRRWRRLRKCPCENHRGMRQ